MDVESADFYYSLNLCYSLILYENYDCSSKNVSANLFELKLAYSFILRRKNNCKQDFLTTQMLKFYGKHLTFNITFCITD